MSITNAERVLWWYQTSLCNRVIIKFDLGTLKVLVEAHGSRVGFVWPDEKNIYSGPSRWYCIDTVASMWLNHRNALSGSEKRVLVGNKIELGMVDTKWSDLEQVIYRETKGIDYNVNGSHDHWIHHWVSGSCHRFLDPIIDYWSERSLGLVHVIHEP
jgi:hypothetical protein